MFGFALHAGAAPAALAGGPGGGLGLQRVPQSAVDLKALALQGGLEVDDVQSAVGGLGAGGGPLVHGVHGGVAEQGDLLLGGQGQRAVVVEQHRALPHLVDVLLEGGVQQRLLGCGIAEIAERALEIGRIAGFAGLDHPGGADAQCAVDVAGIGQRQALSDERNDQNHCEQPGEAGPKL